MIHLFTRTAWILLCFLPLCILRAETIEFQGIKFRIARADPSQVFSCYKDEQGKILHSLSAAVSHFEKAGHDITLLTNGGIFEPGCIPSGLYIENGVEITPINRSRGKGNFFLMPNGIFSIDQEGKAQVAKTEEFKNTATIRLAIQSGPLLLYRGKTHPAFREHSKSHLVRNGVGVDQEGKVVFAITDKKQRCNLWTFAQLFKHLKCQDALFLDGDLSRMIESPTKDVRGQGFATMLAILSPKKP